MTENSDFILEMYKTKIREIGIYFHLQQDYIEKIILQHVQSDNIWLTHLSPYDWVTKRIKGLMDEWDTNTASPKLNF
jgi:hypothetical protein